MKLNGTDVGSDPSDVTNWSDLPGSAVDGAMYHITATGEHFSYNSTVGAFVPALLSQKTFTSNIDPLAGDVLPGTLGDWTETTSGGGAITIDSGAIKFNTTGVSSRKAFAKGVHTISGADWYWKAQLKASDYTGTVNNPAAVMFCYDGGRQVRLHLRSGAGAGGGDRADMISGGGTSPRGAIFVDVVLDDFQTIEAVGLVSKNVVYYFVDGALAMVNEHTEHRSGGGDLFYIGDDTSGASATMWCKNFALYKLS